MNIPKNNAKLKTARGLRQNMTPNERKLWYMFLQTYPVKIYKQRIIGEYIVDFYCATAKFVIEVDGTQHYEPKGINYDMKRDEYLQSLGLKVLRFSNRDVELKFTSVCEQIHNVISERM